MSIQNPADKMAYTPQIRLDKLDDLRVDIGCGAKKMKKHQGLIGVDVVDLGQEIVWDVDRGIPLPDDSTKEVFMHHVLEHLKDPLFVLNECWRILKKGGELEIVVPHHQQSGAYVLHHTHFFSDMSFKHLTIHGLYERYGIRQWSMVELNVGEEAWVDDYGEPTIHCILTPAK